MTYDKTNWVDGVTPVSAQNMNKLETQYDKAKELVDTHKAEKATQSALGHVKQGSGVQIADGVLSVDSDIPNIVTGTYTGDGTSDRVINVGAQIGLIIVTSRDAAGWTVQFICYSTDRSFRHYPGTTSAQIHQLSTEMKITTNGFIVSGNSANRSSEVYDYIAFVYH